MLTHIGGCANHRLFCTTSLVVDGPGINKTMALTRALVTRYTKSSQAANRMQDVGMRRRSTHGCTVRAIYLQSAISLHEEVDGIAALLSSVD